MVVKHILIALRQMAKEKALSLFAISGLSVGITSFLVILFYVNKETSYDTGYSHSSVIYRIISDYRIGLQNNTSAWTPGPVIPQVSEQLPKVTDGVRLFRYRSPVLVIEKTGDKHFSEENLLWADANVFDVFDFPFIEGNAAKALARPNTIVLTEAAANKYFGTANPVGKVLTVASFTDFEITGVIRNIPDNTHFKADFICSLNTLPQLWGRDILSNWGNSFLYSYIKINDVKDLPAVEKKINALAARHLPETPEASYKFLLQPVQDIHLHSHYQNEWQPNPDVKYIYILTTTGVLVLLISVINFVNLSIARSERRTKEIGIRQVIGSTKSQIAKQFLIENLLYGILAYLLSIVAFQPVLSAISDAFAMSLQFSREVFLELLFTGGAAIFVLVLAATLYPAYVISRVKAALALKGTVVKIGQGINFWRALVTFQILITTALITAVLVIRQQLIYVHNKPLGYDEKRLIHIPLFSDESQRNHTPFKNLLLQNPQVAGVSACSHIIGGTLYQSGYSIFKNQQEREEVMWQRIHADYDYCKTYGIEIIAGRDFSAGMPSDTSGFLVNEAATRALGVKKAAAAVGMEVEYDGYKRGRIIGVTRDFHFKSMHFAIEPLIVHFAPHRFRFLTVNFLNGDQTIKWIEKAWKEFDESPFTYTSSTGSSSVGYVSERLLYKLIFAFTAVAMLLSVAGLAALSLYTITLKRKEISIRRLFGAGTVNVLVRLSGHFALLLLTGFLLSIPLSLWSLDLWLSNFAFRIALSWKVFLAAGFISFLFSASSIMLPLFLNVSRSRSTKILNENG